MKKLLVYILNISLVLMSPGVALAKLDITTMQPFKMEVMPSPTPQDLSAYTPSLANSEDFLSVLHNIADHGMNEKLGYQRELSGKTPFGVARRFAVRYAAFQKAAQIEYQGQWKTLLNYNIEAAQTDFSVSQKLWKNRNISFSQAVSAKDRVSSVGLGINFDW